MLSKSQSKLITQLKQKKYRTINKLFLVEGIKGVNEFLTSNFKLNHLFATEDYVAPIAIKQKTTITSNELKKISSYKTPNQVIAIFEIPENDQIKNQGLTLVLDQINDPGNLGTIIRLCDWFNVDQLICSNDTVDCYNSKTVQATMGSLTRTSIVYTDIIHFLNRDERPIYGSFLSGKNVYQTTLEKNAILIMGNEANGISQEIEILITQKITIPQFGEIQKTESLNVASATSILLSEFKRSN